MTPTAGLYFFAEDYLKFLKDLKHLCSTEVKEIKLDDSKYKENLIVKGQRHVPIGKVEMWKSSSYTTRHLMKQKKNGNAGVAESVGTGSLSKIPR